MELREEFVVAYSDCLTVFKSGTNLSFTAKYLTVLSNQDYKKKAFVVLRTPASLLTKELGAFEKIKIRAEHLIGYSKGTDLKPDSVGLSYFYCVKGKSKQKSSFFEFFRHCSHRSQLPDSEE